MICRLLPSQSICLNSGYALLTRSGDSLTGSGFDQFNSRPLSFNEIGNQFQIQMYHHAAITSTDLPSLRGRKVLDIGCGRGGGLAFLNDYFEPTLAMGVDSCIQSVTFAR